MAFIVPDRINEVKIGEYTLKIKERIIPDSARSNKYQTSYCQKGDPVKPCAKLGGGKAMGICIHNTGNISVSSATTPAEQYSRAMWPNCNLKGVAVHFFVYKDDIWQNLALNEQGWHSGDGSKKKESHKKGVKINGNINTIAIESIGDFPESTETTARLTAYLLKALSLSPETDVYTHNFFSPSKYCPKYILPTLSKFEQRVKDIFYSDSAVKEEKTDEKTDETPEKEYSIGDTVNFAGGYHYSNSNAASPTGGIRKPGIAKITNLNLKGKHPYHLIAEKGKGSNVYGWVDKITFSEYDKEKEKTAPEYYPKTPYTGNSIVDGLKKIAVDSSYSHREKIAKANGITDYKGTASQNTKMLNFLKNGLLIKE